jgi:hypothetical protein
MSWRAELRGRGRWWALRAPCACWLMIVIGGAIVTIALPLPLIRFDLGFSESTFPMHRNYYCNTQTFKDHVQLARENLGCRISTDARGKGSRE